MKMTMEEQLAGLLGREEIRDFWAGLGANADMGFHYLDCARIILDGDNARSQPERCLNARQ